MSPTELVEKFILSGNCNLMMLHIKRWLAPPVFPDDEIKTRRANLLNSALINISTLAPMLFIGDLLGGKSHLPSFAAEVLAFAFCLVFRSWMHRGRVRLASIGLITMGIVLITAVVASKGTIRVPTTAMYLLVVITTGLLFDLRGMMITTALCSLLIGGLIGAENAGLLPRPDYSVTITQWVTYTVIFAWTGSLTFSSLQAMLQALMRADKEIIDRKRAEEMLQEGEQRWATTLSSIGDAIIATDIEGRITFMNTTAEELTGWTLAEALTRPVTEVFNIINNQTRQTIEDPVTEVLEKEMIVGLANHALLVRKDGAEIPIDNSGAPIKSREGETTGVVLVFRDITERKRAEEALQESEKKYRELIKYAPTAIYEIDIRGHRFISVNDAMSQMLGYTRKELLAMDPFDLLDDGSKRIFQERLNEFFSGKIPDTNVEYVAKTKDGREICAILKTTFISDTNGNPIRATVIAHDITERKRAEEALKESNDYIETIIKTSGEGILVVNKEGKFEYGNAAFSKILGWPMDELIGESFMKVIPEDMHEFIRTRWEEIQQGIYNLHEAAIVTKNGSRRDLFVSPNKVKIKGEVKYIVVIKDATEQKLAEKKIADSLAEKEILLREIHHRVKNNMQIVSSLLGLQARNIKEKKYSEIFKDSQSRINSISLTHEKLYRSKDFANIDFDEYIRDLTTKLFHSHGVGGRIELILNIDNVTLGIDQGIPCGLIINELITNSLKYAFPKDGKGEIKISLRRRDENLIELVVGDNGVGIPDDTDFRKTESMGLHLVTILAEDQLHGQIDLDRSRGTEFKIRFSSWVKGRRTLLLSSRR